MSERLAGRYSVVRRLAQGGMGDVLLADFPGDDAHAVTRGLVVVKRVITDHPSFEHQAAMLREEGRVALRLLHDNLVETFFVDEYDDEPLLVMEFLSGRAMSQVLGQAKKRKEAVPVDIALALLRAAACGLHFAHTLTDRGRPLGLIHRDVSPANLFMTFDGRVKIIDFGVAKADDSEIRTSTGILKGKIGYMSPEHALGDRLTPAADMWSLGVLFWETLCAERLFSSSAPSVTLQAISEKPIPLPTIHRKDLPPHVVELAMRLLERRIEKRINTGAALVRAIDKLPEALALPRVDLGGWLSGRFPDEAAQGKNEASRCARMRRRTPVPIGLVEGTASTHIATSDEGAATTIIGPQHLQAARDLIAEEEAAANAATVRMKRTDAATVAAAAAAATLADEESATRRTVTSGPSPATEAVGDGIADDADDAGDVDALDADVVQVDDIDPAATLPEGSLSSAALAREVERALPELNPPDEATWRNERVGEATAPAAPSTASGSTRSSSARPNLVDRQSSWVAVAFLTFGALALAMGVAFSFLAPTPPMRGLVAYAAAGGNSEIVVAQIDAPPEGGRVLDLRADPRVKAAGELRRFADLERALADAGVLRRASLPQSPRGTLAVLLPVLIAGLGMLALAGAVPALFMPPTAARAALQVLLLAASLAVVGVIVEKGELSWPGLEAMRTPARLDAATLLNE